MEEITKPRIIEHIHKSITWTVYDTRWIPVSARFVALGCSPKNTGVLEIYALKQGKVIIYCFINKRLNFYQKEKKNMDLNVVHLVLQQLKIVN